MCRNATTSGEVLCRSCFSCSCPSGEMAATVRLDSLSLDGRSGPVWTFVLMLVGHLQRLEAWPIMREVGSPPKFDPAAGACILCIEERCAPVVCKNW